FLFFPFRRRYILLFLSFFLSFFFYSLGSHRDLHSFPTRRSSDLASDVNTASLGVLGSLLSFGNSRLYALNADGCAADSAVAEREDRKSTRLNSSHGSISYAVFCLKKKKKKQIKIINKKNIKTQRK